MNQPFSPILHLPILLATDGSPTAVLAQQLVMPIVQHLALRSPTQTPDAELDNEPEAKPAFIAVHVQPKPSRFRRPGRSLGSSEDLAPEPSAMTSPATSLSATPDNLEEPPASQTAAASLEPEPTTTFSAASSSTPAQASSDETISSASAPESAEPAPPTEASSGVDATDTPPTGALPAIADLPPALAVLQAELERSNHKVSTSLVAAQGRPATEILKQASQSQAGLIALGCHGTGGAREMLVGSVSAEIARYAGSHVLIARSAEPEHPAQPNWQHVLLVVTGELSTQSAIALTRQLVPIGIQQLTVLCVQPPLTSHYLFGPFATPNPSWQLTQSLQAAQREQSEAILQQAELALSDLDVELEMLVQTGEPGSLICQVAEQRQANLIIIGSDANPKRSKSSPSTPIGRRRLLRLTATADYVIHHANCPVLLSRMFN
ncbi:MAG: universal stress protein [Thainema sp.]